jgi:hypothetical protein
MGNDGESPVFGAFLRFFVIFTFRLLTFQHSICILYSLMKLPCSGVTQWQSERLLTAKLQVRVLPPEPEIQIADFFPAFI